MKKITLKIFLLTILLVMFGAIIGNICLAQSADWDFSSGGYAELPQQTLPNTVANVINAALGLLGILCVLGIFVCVPLGIYFLTKKELVSGAAGEKQLIDIGEILKRGWNLYKNNYRLFINPLLILAGSYVVVFGIFAILMSIYGQGFEQDMTEQSINFAPVIAIFIGFFLIILAYIFVTLWITISIIKIISNLHLGRPVDMSKIYNESFKKVPSYLWVSVLNFLVVLGGMLLFIIPGLIFAIWFTFAPYINILADDNNKSKKGISALKLSYYFTKGRWLDVFIRLFVCGLVVGLISIAISIVALIIFGIITMIAGDNVVLTFIHDVTASILSLILTPLSLSFVVILYYSLVETRPLNQASQPAQTAAPVPPIAPVQ